MRQICSLRARLAKLSRSMRKHSLSPEISVDLPISVKSDVHLFDGQIRPRKRIILLTTGCGVGTCTMCPFPNESLNGVQSSNLINQFNNSFNGDSLNNYQIVTLFCNGNFFRDVEIAPEVRQHIYREVGASQASYLFVESLPQFVTEEKIREAKSYLGDRKLVVYMGLQSSNDFVRETLINTTTTRPTFERAVSILHNYGFIPTAFVMVKPPFLTETEAVIDSCQTIEYLANLGVTHCTLCPTRVAPDTVLELLYKRGLYHPVWAQSVVEILKCNHDKNGSVPMVNTSELKSFLNTDSVCAIGATDKLISNLEQFLFTRDFTLLTDLDTEDRQAYQDFLAKDISTKTLEQRVEEFLESLENARCEVENGKSI